MFAFVVCFLCLVFIVCFIRGFDYGFVVLFGYSALFVACLGYYAGGVCVRLVCLGCVGG